MGVPQPHMARFLEVPRQSVRRRSESSPTPSQHSHTSSSSSKVPLPTNIQEINLEDEFDIIKTINEGCFSKVMLARSKMDGMKDRLALKAIHSEATSLEDFARELNYNYYLSPHPNIVTSYNVSFSWDNCYIYAQEYATFSDLSRHIKKDGMDEVKVKSVATQLVSALEFLHSFNLVHRDVRAENVLVFRRDMSIVKLGDFGHTLASGSAVIKTKTELTACTCWGSSCPPEICEIVLQERYYTHPAEDVWSLTILLIVLLNGDCPWTHAEISDPAYLQWTDWLKRKSLRVPEPFHSFTPRFLRLLKRVLEPKPSKRSKIGEISKYLNDEWIQTTKTNNSNGVSYSLMGRRTSSILVDRHESNATSKSGKGGNTARLSRVYGVSGKKRSTRSLKLDQELEAKEESVTERVGKWIVQTTINQKV